jgi:hypothetical protein
MIRYRPAMIVPERNLPSSGAEGELAGIIAVVLFGRDVPLAGAGADAAMTMVAALSTVTAAASSGRGVPQLGHRSARSDCLPHVVH